MTRRTRARSLALGAVAALALGAMVRAQSTRIDGGAVSPGPEGRGEFGFYWETHLEPPVPALADGVGTLVLLRNGIIHRVVLDPPRRVYFGYDVAVTPLPAKDSYRIEFQPLSLAPSDRQRVLGEAASGFTLLPAPAFPAAQTIRSGDVLALTLLTNATTGQKIVDYVTVQEPSRKFRGFDGVRERGFTFAAGAPRDFTVADAELTIRDPRVTVNGRPVESTADYYSQEAGAVVWIYLPGRGRYLLSLTPNPALGFRRAGEVRGSTLRFTAGDVNVALTSAAAIASGRSAFNLYVLHDPGWKPTYANANVGAFMMGAADRPEYLVGK
jgi:hypothetical protein